jgi:hypothetical protein
VLKAVDSRVLTILTAGKAFEDWLGGEAKSLRVSNLSLDRARTLRELHVEAVKETQLVQTIAYGAVDGLVCVYDLVALPLCNSRGLPRCMVYIHERERNFSLVEAMLQATNEGLPGLAVIRDAAGAPRDFQIAALNDGATRLMQGTAENLRGRRLSEVCTALSMSGTLARIIDVFNEGSSTQFELACPREFGSETHLSVSLATTGVSSR